MWVHYLGVGWLVMKPVSYSPQIPRPFFSRTPGWWIWSSPHSAFSGASSGWWRAMRGSYMKPWRPYNKQAAVQPEDSYPPGTPNIKLTWLAEKSTNWRCIFYWKVGIFQCHVSFQGCMLNISHQKGRTRKNNSTQNGGLSIGGYVVSSQEGMCDRVDQLPLFFI